MTEAQKKAYILADNRMALDAGWDEELLRIEIESLQVRILMYPLRALVRMRSQTFLPGTGRRM